MRNLERQPGAGPGTRPTASERLWAAAFPAAVRHLTTEGDSAVVSEEKRDLASKHSKQEVLRARQESP